MKKQLLFDLSKPLVRKISFRMAAIAALTLLNAVSSSAQTPFTWTGGTSIDFLTSSNWTSTDLSTPTFVATDGFIIPSSGVTNFPVLNTDGTITALGCTTLSLNASGSTLATNIPLTCSSTLFMAAGSTLTTNANFTSTVSSSNGVSGAININAGTFISRLYIQSGSVVTVAAGATLQEVGVNRLGVAGAGTINIDGGILNCTGTGTANLSIGGSVVANIGELNIKNSGTVNYTAPTAISIGAYGYINITGGLLDYGAVNISNAGTINVTAGSLKLSNAAATINATQTSATGVINIAAGGTLETATGSSLIIGNNTATPATAFVTVNVNGTMDVNGTLAMPAPVTPGTYTGLITIDAGSIILTGDQKVAMETLAVTTNVGGIKAVAGKTISVTYDAGTDKTTVVANVTPLGVNDAKLDANAIVAYAQDQNIKIQSGNVILSEVKVYDVRGSLIASKKSIGSNETSINLNASNQVYVVKVTTADGTVVTKKIIQ